MDYKREDTDPAKLIASMAKMETNLSEEEKNEALIVYMDVVNKAYARGFKDAIHIMNQNKKGEKNGQRRIHEKKHA